MATLYLMFERVSYRCCVCCFVCCFGLYILLILWTDCLFACFGCLDWFIWVYDLLGFGLGFVKVWGLGL